MYRGFVDKVCETNEITLTVLTKDFIKITAKLQITNSLMTKKTFSDLNDLKILLLRLFLDGIQRSDGNNNAQLIEHASSHDPGRKWRAENAESRGPQIARRELN